MTPVIYLLVIDSRHPNAVNDFIFLLFHSI
jgi:hypothetical protein